MSYLVGWRRTGSPMVLTTYFHNDGWWSVPVFAPDALAEFIKMSARFTNSLGLAIGLGGPAFGAHGNEYFLAAELMWRPDQSVEAVLNDYYQSAFGPAATPIKQYFDLIAQSHARAAAGVHMVRGQGPKDAWIPPTFLPIQSEAESLMQEALRVTANSDAATRKRVNLVNACWEWARLQSETIEIADKYKGNKSTANAERLVERWGRRQEFLAKLETKGEEWALSRDSITNCDKKYDLERTVSRIKAE
jgi:hypothetical protein